MMTRAKTDARTTRKPSVPAVAVPVESAREPRGARRKRETRARLLNAALQLMAEKGAEGVTVAEITELADVGFGSFYNHFASKDEIHRTLVDTVFEQFGESLAQALRGMTDTAEVIAASVRLTLRHARRNPAWGMFLLREALSPRVFTTGLGRFVLMDIRRAIDAGRIGGDDPLALFLAISGPVLAAISIELQFGRVGVGESALAEFLQLPSESLAERTATVVLRSLGLSAADARRVSNRPLPTLETIQLWTD